MQDGFVDEADLKAHMDVIVGRNAYSQEAIKRLEGLYRAAWKRVGYNHMATLLSFEHLVFQDMPAKLASAPWGS
jgi:hypothetical protein